MVKNATASVGDIRDKGSLSGSGRPPGSPLRKSHLLRISTIFHPKAGSWRQRRWRPGAPRPFLVGVWLRLALDLGGFGDLQLGEIT